jgi:predicted nucleic acid-binding protein
MLRLFVDANTLVSALAFEGNESALLAYAPLGVCELIAVEHVREEVRDTLRQPRLGLSPRERGDALRLVARHVIFLDDPGPEHLNRARGRVRDPKDLPVLVGFEQSGCDYLVTGDRDLRGVVPRIITTNRALALLRRSLEEGDP